MANLLVRGAVAGLVGTLAHSAVMAGGKSLGIMHEPSPKKITSNLMRKTGIDRTPEGPGLTAAWIAGHVGYGMASGLIYELVRSVIPRSPVIGGSLFGGAIWTVSYFKLLPELGLHPPPDEDSQGRQVVMVLAHLAYGIAAAETSERLR